MVRLIAFVFALALTPPALAQYVGNPANMGTGQVTVTTAATQIVVNRTRFSVTIVNNATTAVYLGPTSAVTTATGVLLAGVVGASVTLPYAGTVYGIVAAGSEVVSFVDLY